MMFIAAANEPTMMLILVEKDYQKLQRKETLYVDQTATKGFLFNKVVISLCRDNTEIAQLLKATGHKVPSGMLPEPEVEAFTDERCMGCRAIKHCWEMYEGKCIYCWHALAVKLQQERN